MIIELPWIDFEKPHPNTVAIDPLFDKAQQFLDTKRVSRNEYALGRKFTAGLAN